VEEKNLNFMKKVIINYVSIIIGFAIIFSIVSCNSNNVERSDQSVTDTNQSHTISNNLTQVISDKEWNLSLFDVPSDAIVKENNDEINIELSSKKFFLAIDDNGSFHKAQTLKITCTCNSSKAGCSPASGVGTIGCMVTTCSSCDKKNGYIEQPDLQLNHVILINNNLDNNVKFINNIEELNNKILLPSAYLSHDLFVDILKNLEKNLIKSDNDNTETKVLPILIYDYVVFIEVPKDIDNTTPYLVGGIKCKCNSSDSCPKNSKLITTWCDTTNCQSCTMSDNVIALPNKEQ
jgi:hypothetical protein